MGNCRVSRKNPKKNVENSWLILYSVREKFVVSNTCIDFVGCAPFDLVWYLVSQKIKKSDGANRLEMQNISRVLIANTQFCK